VDVETQALQTVGELVDELQRRHGSLLIRADAGQWTVVVAVTDSVLSAEGDQPIGEEAYRESGPHLPALLATIREAMRRHEAAGRLAPGGGDGA
jgi:hypothetical protein